MKTDISILEELSPDVLYNYVAMRQRIDVEANSIYSITSMMALIETCGDDKAEVDPIALGKINQILHTNILNIWEIMDDFIYIVQAKLELEKLKK